MRSVFFFTVIATIIARIGNPLEGHRKIRTSKNRYGYVKALAKTEVAFEWPHRRISSTDSENKGTLHLHHLFC